MRNYEVRRTTGKSVKLTVTSERVTIKLPETLNKESSERITKFLREVADSQPNPEHSLRGELNSELFVEGGVFNLRNQSRTVSHKYEIK